MIDYDKIKRQLSNLDDLIEVQCSKGNYDCDDYMLGIANGLLLAKSCFTNEEPAFLSNKPKPKYKKGDEVWVNKLSIFNFSIVSIEGSNYYDGDDWYEEDELYPTKADLIESQIEYWQKQMHAEVYPFLPPDMVHGAVKHIMEQAESFKNSIASFESPIEGFKVATPDYPTCMSTGKECQHVSDGTATALLCNPPIYTMKCKLCGEFYR